MKATVNFVVQDPGEKEIELTTWVDHVLKKGTVPETLATNAGTASIAAAARLENATVADETYKLEVKAYVSDTSTTEEKALPGHNDAWLAEMADYQNDSTTKYHVTYSYDEGETGNELDEEEVFFYCNSSETYTETHEGITGADGILQQLDVAMASLYIDGNDGDSDPDHWAGVSDAVSIGYLYIRFEGSLRVHTADSYSAFISAEADTGAAAANSNS